MELVPDECPPPIPAPESPTWVVIVESSTRIESIDKSSDELDHVPMPAPSVDVTVNVHPMNRSCPQVPEVPMAAAGRLVARTLNCPEPFPLKVILEFSRQFTPPPSLSRELWPVRVTKTLLLLTVNGKLPDKLTLSNSIKIVASEIWTTLFGPPEDNTQEEPVRN
jgi:hypothetical protein